MLLSMNAFSLFFAIILAVVLLGISIGGFVGSKLSKMVSLNNAVSYSLLSAGIFVILTYVGYIHIFTWVYSNVPKTHPFAIVITALFLACPIAICSGIVFPLLGQLIHKHVNNDAAATGVLTFCNTFGSMIGALVAGIVFVPQFGIETSFIILGVGYVLLAGSMFELKGNYLSIENTLKVYAVCIAPILIFFPHGTIEKYLDIPTKKYKQLGERRIAVSEGLTETIQYLRRSFFGFTHYVRLITNGHPMSSTRFLPRRYMKMYVYLPVAIHPHIERAALICFGCGQTAKALTDTRSIEEIDFVDISDDVFRMSKHVFPKDEDNPIHDPRVTVHVEDGRFFLQTTKKKYDLITGEPPPPSYKGIEKLAPPQNLWVKGPASADGHRGSRG